MFFLNTQSKESIFEQIQNQILRFIQAGVLAPGDRLPSVRQLAQENGINPNTVSKAYIELEKNGYVYKLMKDYYKNLPAYNCGVDVCDFEPKTLDELIYIKEENKNEPYIN